MRGESARPGKRPLRSLSAAEKMDAIQRVHDGESKASVARDIGVPESTLRGWCKSEIKIRGMARNTSTPDSEAHSPASSSGGNPLAMTAGTANLPGEDEGPSVKKIKYDHSVGCSSNDNSENNEASQIDNKAKIDYMNNFITMAGMRPDNGSLLLQQLGILSSATNANFGANLTGNLGANLTAGLGANLNTNIGASLAKNLLMPTGLTHPAVGLVENGLQYTKSSGGLHSAHSKRHSISAIAPTQIESVNKSGTRKCLPPAAEAPSTPVPASPRKTYESHSQQPKNSKKDPSSGNRKIDEALWQWLTQQQQILGAQATHFNPATTQDGSWFWQWYKNLYPYNTAQSPNHMKPSKSKSRALIDSMVCQNNNIEHYQRSLNVTEDNVMSLSMEEVINCGETFYKWLDNCSLPTVSRVLIMQLKFLVDSLKCRTNPINNSVKKSRK